MNQRGRLAIYERDGGLCGFCGQAVPLEAMQLDHYPVPRALGGLAVPENLRVAHRRCNIKAGKAVAAERRALGLPSASGTIMLRHVPAELWHRVRKASAGESTPDKRVTMRDVLLEALREWLAKRGY